MADAPLFVVYRRCCKVWPIAIGYPVRRCGLCGEVPAEPAEEADRLAEALRAYHLTGSNRASSAAGAEAALAAYEEARRAL